MADICKISKSIAKTCGQISSAGVAEVAFATFNSAKIMDSVASTDASASGRTVGQMGFIDDTDFATWVGTGSDAIKFYSAKVARDTASATAAVQAGANPDAKSIQHTVSGQFNGSSILDGSGVKIQGEDLLSFVMSDVVIAVRYNDGTIKFYGTTNGMSCTQFDEATGSTGTDALGYTFSYQGTEGVYPIVATGDLDWATVIA